MTIRLSALAADVSKEEAGDWIDSSDLPGVRFKVLSLNAPTFVMARDLLMQRWARKYKRQPVPLDVRHDELGRLFADHILRGWTGFDDEYSPELAEKLLRDRSYRTLLAAVENAAAIVGEGDVEFVEDAEKNSEAPSAGV